MRRQMNQRWDPEMHQEWVGREDSLKRGQKIRSERKKRPSKERCHENQEVKGIHGLWY